MQLTVSMLSPFHKEEHLKPGLLQLGSAQSGLLHSKSLISVWQTCYTVTPIHIRVFTVFEREILFSSLHFVLLRGLPNVDKRILTELARENSRLVWLIWRCIQTQTRFTWFQFCAASNSWKFLQGTYLWSGSLLGCETKLALSTSKCLVWHSS